MIEGQFRSSVMLYDHTLEIFPDLPSTGSAEIGKVAMVHNWTNIAEQYSVLMVYHFRDALHSVKRNLEQTKVLQSKVDMPTIRRAIEEFAVLFPHARELRDQVGHFVDKIYSPEKLAKNRPDTPEYAHGAIDFPTRRLLFGHEGTQIFQELSYAEADKLKRVKLIVYEAFG